MTNILGLRGRQTAAHLLLLGMTSICCTSQHSARHTLFANKHTHTQVISNHTQQKQSVRQTVTHSLLDSVCISTPETVDVRTQNTHIRTNAPGVKPAIPSTSNANHIRTDSSPAISETPSSNHTAHNIKSQTQSKINEYGLPSPVKVKTLRRLLLGYNRKLEKKSHLSKGSNMAQIQVNI